MRPVIQSQQCHRQRGLTMLELMIGISILSIIVGFAVPSIYSIIQNNRATAEANEFIAALNLARAEAVKRRDVVRVCASRDGQTCLGTADITTQWETGWVVIANDGTLVRAHDALSSGTTLTGDVQGVQYASTGGAVRTTPPVFTLVVDGCTGDNARTITLSVTGRVMVKRSACQ